MRTEMNSVTPDAQRFLYTVASTCSWSILYNTRVTAKCNSLIFKKCILLRVSTMYEFGFSCQTQQYTNNSLTFRCA
jgi:hypothetical protein